MASPEDTCSQEGAHLNPTSLGTPLHSYTNPLQHYTTFSLLPHSTHTASHTPQHLAQYQCDSEKHGPELQHNNLSCIFYYILHSHSSVSLFLLLWSWGISAYTLPDVWRSFCVCVYVRVHACVHACVRVCMCACVCAGVYISIHIAKHYRNVAELLYLSVTNYHRLLPPDYIPTLHISPLVHLRQSLSMCQHLLVHSAVSMMELLCLWVCMLCNWWSIVSDYVQ